MIELFDLKNTSSIWNYNMGQSEKYVFQDLILFILFNKVSKEIVFKGGTALTKAYGLRRFSEDLDFNIVDEIDAESIIKAGLNRFSINYEFLRQETTDNSKKYKIMIRGPLFKEGNKRSLCSIRLDFSRREELMLPAETIMIRHNLNFIPMFEIIVMSKKEIFAEKIRAVFTRDMARDLYDLYYLDDSVASVEIINKKLELYHKSFSISSLKEHIQRKKQVWDSELRHLVTDYPEYGAAEKKIMGYFR